MRKFLFIIFFLTIGLLYLFRIDKLIVEKLSFSNNFKNIYINNIINVSSKIEKYFNNVTTIDRLQKDNNELKQYQILYQTTQKRLDTLKKFISEMDVNIINSHNVKLAKVLSYINFNDFTKVWLDLPKVDDTILGLIVKDYAAGIVINNNGKSVALLNGNKECSYAVFIGEDKVPGIVTSSKDGKNLTIQFIPIWAEIKIGDEVITSGMDNIFFEGLKVGRISEESKRPDMQTAIVKPYAKVLKKKYFYTYRHYSYDKKETLIEK